MLLAARLPREEGQRLVPYDDATGKPVTAPVGNLTWGRGYNLMQCGSPALFDAMDAFLLAAIEAQLQKFGWYAALENQPLVNTEQPRGHTCRVQCQYDRLWAC